MRGAKKYNPYSSRGLHKFATLNAELATKRDFVARKMGVPKDLLRFTYSGDKCIPVVVKGKRDDGDAVVPSVKNYEDYKDKNDIKEFVRITGMDFCTEEPSRSCKRGGVMGPKDHIGDVIGFIILLFGMIFFGRLWAICCTCLWWYFLSNFTRDGNPRCRTRDATNKSRITVLIDVQSKKKNKLILDGLMLGNKELKYK